MSDRSDIEDAIVAAHQAGDDASATTLAQHLATLPDEPSAPLPGFTTQGALDNPELAARYAAGEKLTPDEEAKLAGPVNVPTVNGGFFHRIGEAITGKDRRVESTEALPDWASLPELNSFSLASAKTGLGTLLSNPDEAVKVIQSNFPSAQVRKDEKGNYIIKSSIDGKDYAIKPGFRVSDIPKTIGTAAAFSPAGAIEGGALKIGAGAAATQAGIEGTQAATGGDFNPGDVAMAGVVGAAVPALANVLEPAGSAIAGAYRGLTGTAAAEAPKIAPTLPVVNQPVADLAATARKAGLGSDAAKQTLANESAPSPTLLADYKRLGIEDYVDPGHITTNENYRILDAALKNNAVAGPYVAEGMKIKAIAERATKLINDIGGDRDLSAVNQSVRDKLEASRDQLKASAGKLYDKVRDSIPQRSPAPAKNLVAYLQEEAKNLGGVKNLDPAQQKLLKQLSASEDGTEPTYALLDKVRRDIGSGFDRLGPFENTSSRDLKKLYSALSQDQIAAAKSAGVSDALEQANRASQTYLGMQDDLQAIFGKALDKSLVPSLTSGTKSLAKGDTAPFVKLIGLIPKEQRAEVVASALSSVFRKASTRGVDGMDFTGYAKWYEGLMVNRQAYSAIMSNLPLGAAKQLHALYRVSKGISDSLAAPTRARTGYASEIRRSISGADAMQSKLIDYAKNIGLRTAERVPVVGKPIAAAVGLALEKNKTAAVDAVESLITSPEFVEMATASTEQARQEAARKFAYSSKFTKFARTIGNPRELSNREQWVLRALQAGQQPKQQQTSK